MSCVNAYMNLQIHPKGIVKPCCMSKKSLVTNDGDTLLDEASIIEFWNSKDRQQFIDDLESGVQVPECDACWREEAAGKQSKRIRDNEKFKDRIFTRESMPEVLDISLGNTCNLKCRICAPIHSTQWLQEEAKRLYPDNSNEEIRKSSFWRYKKIFDSSNRMLWDGLRELYPNLQHMDLAGGEPFYVDNHWKILEDIHKQGYSKNISLHYNTNGTIYPEKYTHLLNEFKSVDIQISSDGVGKQFTYLRHPADFDLVEQNISSFMNHKDWKLGMCISVSAFNVYDIFETFEHYAEKGLGIYINIVHDNRSPRILPKALKDVIINKLKQTESKHDKTHWQIQRDMICDYIENNHGTHEDFEMWLDELLMRDIIRDESFEQVFSEYYSVMENLGLLKSNKGRII